MNPVILGKILKWIEIASIAISLTGVILKLLHLTGANEFTMFGLLSLSTTFFLYGNLKSNEPQHKSFAEYLVFVQRKILYIGLSVYWVGFLFTILHLAGANEMLIIGLGTIVICSLISMVLIMGNRNRMKTLQAPLLRVAVTMIIYFSLPLFR